MQFFENYDVVVIGAGHAGCEAALACARLGHSTLLATLNLDALARHCHISKVYLSRLFVQETGMPPQRYKNWLRVKKARELIEAGAPVSRAAEAVGFSDMVYFNKLFHQFYGIAPREAKK